jgi:hypothetical protein
MPSPSPFSPSSPSPSLLTNAIRKTYYDSIKRVAVSLEEPTYYEIFRKAQEQEWGEREKEKEMEKERCPSL